MRVISGRAKGHKLVAPSSKRVRPALDKVKEAIFDILFCVNELSVLDIYAGSGSIGIEALSRGASVAVFVEEWDQAVQSIRRNLAHCKLEDRGKIIQLQAHKAIPRIARTYAPFDLIFIDPPYLKELVGKTLEQISRSTLINEDTTIVVEHHPKEPIGEIPGLILTDSRKYGQTLVSFLKKNVQESA